MEYRYKTQGTCSQFIEFELNDNVVSNVKYYGGCAGNLTAIPILVEGMTVEEIENKLGKVDCNGRGTSCSAQLAIAVRTAYDEQNASK